MKKSLWIAAVAMAVGFGASTQAATNATFGTWDFETPAAGTVVPPAGMADPYGSWAADTNNGVALVTNVSVGGTEGFVRTSPLPAGAHTKSVYFDGSITNKFDSDETVGLGLKRYRTDFLLKPGQLEDLSLLNNVDSAARLAFYFNTASNFVLLHGNVGSWQTSTVTSVTYGSNDWLRITIDQDYAVAQSARRYFSVWINGTNVTHANGYSRSVNTFTSGGGVWFQMKDAGTSPNRGMNSLVGMGIGLLDDVANYEFSDAPSTIDVFASTFNSAYGNISPAGTLTITNGIDQTFTLTVASGVAGYVLGLNAGANQIYTNTADQSVLSTNWVVTFAQVSSGNTNVQAQFAAKTGTSSDWLDSIFTIGNGGDYPDFATAAAADADGDGFNNLQEAIAGTNPEDNTSFLKISTITVNGGEVSVTFEGSASGSTEAYGLLEADVVGGPYSNVATRAKVAGTLGVTNTPSVQPKFYKVVVPYTGE